MGSLRTLYQSPTPHTFQMPSEAGEGYCLQGLWCVLLFTVLSACSRWVKGAAGSCFQHGESEAKVDRWTCDGAQSQNPHEVHQLQSLCSSFTFLLKYLESHALAPGFPNTWLQRHPRHNPISPALLSLPGLHALSSLIPLLYRKEFPVSLALGGSVKGASSKTKYCPKPFYKNGLFFSLIFKQPS